MSINDKQP